MAWFRRDNESDRTSSADDVRGDGAPLPDLPDTQQEWYLNLKRRLHTEIVADFNLGMVERLSEAELQLEVRKKAEDLVRRNAELLSLPDRDRLIEELLDEAFGFGPLEGLMRDHQISDILVNGPRQVYTEKHGRLELSKVAFQDEGHLLQIVQRIVASTGRRIDENSPMVDARLPDGSRLNAVIKPLAINGPLVSIRRFGGRPLMVEDLLTNGSMTPEMVEFLAACVQARVNIVISGGTGTGKTTLLNCLSRYIPKSERVATIEDAAELMLQQPHVVKMETRPANLEGEGEVTMRDLVRNALRMRPDRIIVGECRGPEALDMLQAMNTGHEGSLTTIHANTPRDAVTRLEMMIGMGGFEMPIWVIRKQVASSIDVVVQVSRLMGGRRKVVRVSEITGMESDAVMMHDLFEFVQTGIDENQSAVGHFLATGIRPDCLDRIAASGIRLPVDLFEPRRLDIAVRR
jgi:pilus assembly protein CpaF